MRAQFNVAAGLTNNTNNKNYEPKNDYQCRTRGGALHRLRVGKM
jgi:hypothetical protein